MMIGAMSRPDSSITVILYQVSYISRPQPCPCSRDHAEDDRVPVDRHFLRRDPQHGNLRAVAHVRKQFLEVRLVSIHFETQDEALQHPKLILRIENGLFPRVVRQGHTHAARQMEAMYAFTSANHDVPRARVPRDFRGHDTDRPPLR